MGENHTHMLLLEMKNPHWCIWFYGLVEPLESDWLIGSCLLVNSFHAVFFWLKCPDFSLSLPIKYPHVVCTLGPNRLGNPQKILGSRGGCLGGCSLRQVCFCFIPKPRKIFMADCRSPREDSSPLVRWFNYCVYLTMYCWLYVCCLNGIEILNLFKFGLINLVICTPTYIFNIYIHIHKYLYINRYDIRYIYICVCCVCV